MTVSFRTLVDVAEAIADAFFMSFSDFESLDINVEAEIVADVVELMLIVVSALSVLPWSLLCDSVLMFPPCSAVVDVEADVDATSTVVVSVLTSVLPSDDSFEASSLFSCEFSEESTMQTPSLKTVPDPQVWSVACPSRHS